MTWLYLKLRKLILPLEEINTNLPSMGQIVDLGCGQGIIAEFLAQTKTRNVVGMDSDTSRLPKSYQKNLNFIKQDLTKVKLSKINGAVISDVLHHLEPKDQKTLLKKVYLALEKKGVLIIKEIDTGEFVRSKLSRFWDFILYPHEKIYFQSALHLKKFLINTGYKQIEILRPCRLFPGSTTLIVGRK